MDIWNEERDLEQPYIFSKYAYSKNKILISYS